MISFGFTKRSGSFFECSLLFELVCIDFFSLNISLLVFYLFLGLGMK